MESTGANLSILLLLWPLLHALQYPEQNYFPCILMLPPLLELDMKLAYSSQATAAIKCEERAVGFIERVWAGTPCSRHSSNLTKKVLGMMKPRSVPRDKRALSAARAHFWSVCTRELRKEQGRNHSYRIIGLNDWEETLCRHICWVQPPYSNM